MADNDSSSDYDGPAQAQALPVNTNLEIDESRPASTAEEYLLRVRNERKKLPKVELNHIRLMFMIITSLFLLHRYFMQKSMPHHCHVPEIQANVSIVTLNISNHQTLHKMQIHHFYRIKNGEKRLLPLSGLNVKQ